MHDMIWGTSSTLYFLDTSKVEAKLRTREYDKLDKYRRLSLILKDTYLQENR